MSANWKLAALVGLGLTVCAPWAAGQDDGDKEPDKEGERRGWREAEGEAEKEGEQGPDGEQRRNAVDGDEDPLEKIKKILGLMEQVEDKLYEADTGEFTQEEQKQIVEAMRFEDKTHKQMEDLIRKIEEMAQQQQSQSSSSSDSQQQQQKQQQQQQNKNETEQEKQQRQQRERERMAREKEEERRRQMQQQKQQQQQQQPQDGQHQQQPQQRGEDEKPPEDQSGDLRDDPRADGRWGQLPKKWFQDAARASEKEPPSRWRRIIERYREELARDTD